MRPLFIVGLARSGTNLLARMLDRHPLVSVALDPLMPVFRSMRNAILQTRTTEPVRRRFNPDAPFQDFYFDPDGPALLDTLLAADADVPVAAADVERLRPLLRARAALESPELAERICLLEGRTYAELIWDALRIIADAKPGAAWVGCKEVWIFDFIPLLARLFPNCRIYAIERDPRAIVASIIAMAARDPSQAAHAPSYMRHWRKSIAEARRFARDASLAGRFRALGYEDLVADPRAQARLLCEELSVAFDPRMLALSADGWSGNSSYDRGKDVYASSVQRWRERIPVDAWQAVDFLCGPEMRLTSYTPELHAESGDLDAYLARADRAQASWRSSSGDAAADYRNELGRWQLLEAAGTADTEVVRMAFLFNDTYEAIRRAWHL